MKPGCSSCSVLARSTADVGALHISTRPWAGAHLWHGGTSAHRRRDRSAPAPAVVLTPGPGIDVTAAGVIVHAGGPEPEPSRLLNGISDVRAFFHTNAVPLYFISPTPFNLLGIDRWVRNFFYLTYFDSFEGAHSRVFVPRRRDRIDFGSMGDVCNHLLRDPETLDFIARRGPGGKACFVWLDEKTEALAAPGGLRGMDPPAELRHRLGS